jgi:hypothetical protein
MRKKAAALEKWNWTIIFTWIKVHVAIYGSEVADKLAKEAARNYDTSFDRIPKSARVQEGPDQSIAKWQIQWTILQKGLQQNSSSPL